VLHPLERGANCGFRAISAGGQKGVVPSIHFWRPFALVSTQSSAGPRVYLLRRLPIRWIGFCDVCGHRWIPETENPQNCPSKWCSSTLWDKGGGSTAPDTHGRSGQPGLESSGAALTITMDEQTSHSVTVGMQEQCRKGIRRLQNEMRNCVIAPKLSGAKVLPIYRRNLLNEGRNKRTI
jgi:hypothetical protein